MQYMTIYNHYIYLKFGDKVFADLYSDTIKAFRAFV